MESSRNALVQSLEGDTFSGVHEIHVTAANQTEKDYFIWACGIVGVKAHIIYNEVPSGETTVDYLTASDFKGTSIRAVAEMDRIAMGLKQTGIDVVREKIETTPWHPLARTVKSPDNPPNTYFESHFTLPDLPVIRNWQHVHKGNVPFYISTTDYKRENGLVFGTVRDYNTTSPEFCRTIDQIYQALLSHTVIAYPTVEFAMYDSNPNHDHEWVSAY